MRDVWHTVQHRYHSLSATVAQPKNCCLALVEASWNVMAKAQKPDFVFRRKGRVHLNRRGRQFSRLLAPKVCASAVVMLDTPCSEVVWMVLATHSIRQFPLHFPSRALPCVITFQLEFTTNELKYITTTPDNDGALFWLKHAPLVAVIVGRSCYIF